MTTTQTSLALAAFVRCQHSIRLGNFGKILRVDLSQHVIRRGFPFLTLTELKIAPATSDCSLFWLVLCSPIPWPPTQVTTNASATGVAGATFSASKTLATNGAQFFIWRDAWSLDKYTLAFEPTSARRTLRFAAIR